MKSVNRVMLLGHATHDAEIKKLPSSRTVCNFGLATNRTWKDSDGKKQSVAEFHNLVAWGKLGDICGEYIRKGGPIYVEGYLRTTSWEKEGNPKQYRTEIIVENVVLLGAKGDIEVPTLNEADVPGEADSKN